MATGNSPNVAGSSAYQRDLLRNGINRDGQAPGGAGVVSNPDPERAPTDAGDAFAGKGKLLEADPKEAFRLVDALVRRQERLAKNRFAIDKHFTATKEGYWGSTLIKIENQNEYVQSFLPGTRDRLQSAAVPNKQAELCQKLTETLLVDPPVLDPTPEDDSETAERGADLAREYLLQDAGEAGTDDLTLFAFQVEAGTTRGAVYNHYWVDPTGGGSVAKRIKAHPEAVDPANPLVGPDGMPTTDYVERYVTADGQFTVNPAEADRVWVPRVRIDKLGREHVRLFPETADLAHAQQAVVVHYCTVAEARRRWPETLGALSDEAFTPLCGWIPLRPLALLPVALRATWREGWESAAKGETRGATDQRLLFYYAYYGLAEPDYPEGAILYLNGAAGGTLLAKDTLTATVQVPSEVRQDEEVTDRRDLDIPLAELRLLPDTVDRDPTGTPFMRRVAGAGESGSTMATAMLHAIDQVLNPVRYSIGTSSASAEDVESARSTGDFVNVLNKDEVPQLEAARELPAAFFNFYQLLNDGMDASAGLRPPEAAKSKQVKSGVALRIEVEEATKTLTRMNYALHACWARHGRIKLQMAEKHFTVEQMLRYTGTDGAAKQEWFTGNDFARVTGVAIRTGTGTMLPPMEKVNLAIQLGSAGLMGPAEVAEVARPAFRKQLGNDENPHEQRIERQVSSFQEGPPEGWEAEQAAYAQAVVAHAQESQMLLAADPMAALAPEPQGPWTPFAAEPVDAEPEVAALRARRLGREMAKVEFSKFPEPWKQVLRDAYAVAQGAVQAAALAATQPMPGSPAAGSSGAPQNATIPEVAA